MRVVAISRARPIGEPTVLTFNGDLHAVALPLPAQWSVEQRAQWSTRFEYNQEAALRELLVALSVEKELTAAGA